MMISLRNVLCGIAAALVLSAAVHAQQEVSAEELQAQIARLRQQVAELEQVKAQLDRLERQMAKMKGLTCGVPSLAAGCHGPIPSSCSTVPRGSQCLHRILPLVQR
jgi:uncharacterized coiled-coil protein SlyX